LALGGGGGVGVGGGLWGAVLKSADLCLLKIRGSGIGLGIEKKKTAKVIDTGYKCIV
jgi:hypothetical protein